MFSKQSHSPQNQYQTTRKRGPSITAAQAAKLSAAWLEGKSKYFPPIAPSTLPEWRQGLQTRFDPEQILLVNGLVYYVGKARQFAVQGDYDASIQLFAVAQRMAQDPRLDGQSRLLCTAEMQAAEAYLDFVTGDFAGARKRLETAMAADEALEDEFGHSVLHIHRIHLANNRIKVEAGARNLQGALVLAADILGYIQGQADSIALPGRWGSCWRSSLTEDPQVFLISQTSMEVACAMAGLIDESAHSAWMQCLATVEFTQCPQAAREIAEWYRVKTALLNAMHLGREQVQAFCGLAQAYLAAGPGEARLLWHAACFDLLLLCSDSASANCLLLQGQLMEELKHANYLPRAVRARIAQAVSHAEAMQLQQV